MSNETPDFSPAKIGSTFKYESQKSFNSKIKDPILYNDLKIYLEKCN